MLQQTSARQEDINGFITIVGNPLSKEGVFPYSGAQIGHPDAERIFNVYRPAEELADPECINSFKLLPFVDEHAMLGSEDAGGMPAERKGVHGMIGESVYFDPPYLRGNLRIVSESLKSAISHGKIELSPGYRCTYELTPGVFDGQQYDAIQRRIRGNHLALVDEGRTGPDVSVLDRMTFTIDAKELAAMADQEMKDQGGGESTARIKALLDELKPLLKEQEDVRAMLSELGMGMAKADESEGEVVAELEDEAVTVEETVDMDMTRDEDMKGALDAALKRIAKLEANQTGMDSALVSSIADRDALASRVSQFVGTFDSARMTTSQVAKYGVEKLGIPCKAGAEQIALDAWLHGRTPEHHKPVIAQDSKGFDLHKVWSAK
ncbi:structural protein [Pseudomonas phage vB_PcuM_ KLEP17-4]|nr:structural protein [Pseudomonas phage vB_PcuM_ KLEP17-4]